MDPEQAKKLFQQGHISAEMYMKVVGKSLDSNPNVERRAASTTAVRPTTAATDSQAAYQQEQAAQDRDKKARAAAETRDQDPYYTNPQDPGSSPNFKPQSTEDKTLRGMPPTDWGTNNSIAGSFDKYRGRPEDDALREKMHHVITGGDTGQALREKAGQYMDTVTPEHKQALHSAADWLVRKLDPSIQKREQDQETIELDDKLAAAKKLKEDQDTTYGPPKAAMGSGPMVNQGERQPVQMEREFSSDQEKNDYLENLRKQKAQQ